MWRGLWFWNEGEERVNLGIGIGLKGGHLHMQMKQDAEQIKLVVVEYCKLAYTLTEHRQHYPTQVDLQWLKHSVTQQWQLWHTLKTVLMEIWCVTSKLRVLCSSTSCMSFVLIQVKLGLDEMKARKREALSNLMWKKEVNFQFGGLGNCLRFNKMAPMLGQAPYHTSDIWVRSSNWGW